MVNMDSDRITAAWLEGLGFELVRGKYRKLDESQYYEAHVYGVDLNKANIWTGNASAEARRCTQAQLLAVARALGVELGEGKA